MTKLLKIVVPAILILIFAYSCLAPVITQTVPFSFDQARDFLKIEEMVQTKKLTLLGPSAGGIQGMFHGVWWYYLLFIPFLITNGWPMGYYLFTIFLAIVFNTVFFFFLKKETNFPIALLFLAIIASSPFAISNSIVVWNVAVVPYLIMLLIICVNKLIKNQQTIYYFIIPLILGFVFEFEMSFGMLLIPSMIVLFLLSKESRRKALNIRIISLIILGFVIPLMPRIFFELRHDFLQTRALINFIFNPTQQNPTRLIGAFYDRVNLFIGYYKNVFYQERNIFPLFFYSIGLVGLFLGFSKLSSPLKKTLLFLVALTGLLFAFSLVNKNNFFWDYYLKGVQYVLLLITLTGIFALTLHDKKAVRIVYVIIAVCFWFNMEPFLGGGLPFLNNQNQNEGFSKNVAVINYILDKAQDNDYCVRIYTPAVITYSYDYLFQYYSRTKHMKPPQKDYVNDQCFFVIDKEQPGYEFRIKEWKKSNMSAATKIIETKLFGDTEISTGKTN